MKITYNYTLYKTIIKKYYSYLKYINFNRLELFIALIYIQIYIDVQHFQTNKLIKNLGLKKVKPNLTSFENKTFVVPIVAGHSLIGIRNPSI